MLISIILSVIIVVFCVYCLVRYYAGQSEKMNHEIKEVHALLDNIQNAVFAIGRDFQIIDPVSAHTLVLLGPAVVGQSVLDTLFKDLDHKTELFETIRYALSTSFGEPEFQWLLLSDDLPKIIQYQHEKADDSIKNLRSLKLSYQPIFGEKETVEKILFVVEDVTELMRLESEKNENIIKIEMLQSLSQLESSQMTEYFTNCRKLMDEIHSCLAEPQAAFILSKLSLIKRNLHTLKGNAKIYGLSLASNVIHESENQLLKLAPDLQANQPKENQQFIRSIILPIEEVILKYSRTALKYLHFESDFDTGFFERIHGLVCSFENEPIIEKSVGQALIEGFRILALPEDLISRVEQFLIQESRSTDANAQLYHSRESILGFIRLEIQKRSLYPKILGNSHVWYEVMRSLMKLSQLVNSGNMNNQQTEVKSESQGEANILLQVLFLKCQEGKITWLRLFVGQVMSRKITLQQFLECAWIYAAVVTNLNFCRDRNDESLDKFIRFLAEISDDLDIIRIQLYQLDFSSVAFVRAFKESVENGVHPNEIISYITKDTRGKIKTWGAFCCIRPNEDIRRYRALFLDSVEVIVMDNKIKSYVQSDFLLDQLIGLFFTQPGSSVPKWSYLGSSELSRILSDISTAGDLPDATQIRLLEVMGSRLDAVKELSRSYINNPKQFSPRVLNNRVESLYDLPIRPLFLKYSPIIQELAMNLNKKVQLEIIGEDLGMNRFKMNLLHDALLHLIHNSLDHGLESPQVRRESGKPEVGVIRLGALISGKQLQVLVEDDGKGIDFQHIAKSAIEKGVRTEYDISRMTDDQKRDLVFLSGFSTRENVTDLSGRGIGLDVVRTNIEQMGGRIEIQSTPGKGVRFLISFSEATDVIAALQSA